MLRRALPACFTLGLLLVLSAGVSACDSDEGGLTSRTSASFTVRESVEQVHVWNAAPETTLQVVAADGTVVASAPTDELGSLVFRLVPPGKGYSVRLAQDPEDYTGPLTVLGVEESLPDEAFYAGQVLEPGFGYITTRDGTTLSVYVHLPGPPEDGPYPTLVNYSGYSPSRPGDVLAENLKPFCGSYPVLCDAPSHGAGLFGGLVGYASVGVNMRGTGCSGGAYDFFEPLQLLDGYDAIEVIARQPWVKHGKVGMSGLSYPGIATLFVASTRPPNLSAIVAQSVLADSASSTLAPGGIYNQGFALNWIENVLRRAAPSDSRWVRDLIEAGDTVCEENQLLHSQLVDVTAKALDNPFYTDEVAKSVDPSSFVDIIDVPVYLSGQWQDEQTGPHFAALLDKFTSAPATRFTVTNGIHIDGFAPQALMEWKAFLDLYVDREVPSLSEDLRSLTGLMFNGLYGVPLEVPPNPYEGFADYEAAKAAYEAEPPLRVIFESGGVPDLPPQLPEGTFERWFDAWPPPETEARRWYLGPDGVLTDAPPVADGGGSSFVHDPDAGDRVVVASGSVGDLPVDYDYRQLVEGHAAAFVSEPLAQDTVMVGHGSVDLWIRSSADNADLEVNLTEVRDDGQEMYVQSGWLRASYRALRDDATELRPVKTMREEDHALLEPGVWTQARVELMPFAHIFRAGSRVRVSVDTPGDSRAEWKFILLDHGDGPQPTHDIGHDAERPSSVVLPVIPSVDVPSDTPKCDTLRGQPCRAFVPFANTPL